MSLPQSKDSFASFLPKYKSCLAQLDEENKKVFGKILEQWKMTYNSKKVLAKENADLCFENDELRKELSVLKLKLSSTNNIKDSKVNSETKKRRNDDSSIFTDIVSDISFSFSKKVKLNGEIKLKDHKIYKPVLLKVPILNIFLYADRINNMITKDKVNTNRESKEPTINPICFAVTNSSKQNKNSLDMTAITSNAISNPTTNAIISNPTTNAIISNPTTNIIADITSDSEKIVDKRLTPKSAMEAMIKTERRGEIKTEQRNEIKIDRRGEIKAGQENEIKIKRQNEIKINQDCNSNLALNFRDLKTSSHKELNIRIQKKSEESDVKAQKKTEDSNIKIDLSGGVILGTKYITCEDSLLASRLGNIIIANANEKQKFSTFSEFISKCRELFSFTPEQISFMNSLRPEDLILVMNGYKNNICPSNFSVSGSLSKSNTPYEISLGQLIKQKITFHSLDELPAEEMKQLILRTSKFGVEYDPIVVKEKMIKLLENGMRQFKK